MRSIILLFLPILVFAQTNFVSTDSYESNFQLVQREIASVYNPKTTTFTGNKYFFKKSKDAVLNFFDLMNLLKLKLIIIYWIKPSTLMARKKL